jgi:hypothetical protein
MAAYEFYWLDLTGVCQIIEKSKGRVKAVLLSYVKIFLSSLSLRDRQLARLSY